MKKGRRSTSIPIIGNRLKAILALKGYSQSKLALKVSTTRETINRSINGNRIEPTLLDQICTTLDVSPDYIKGSFNDKPDRFSPDPDPTQYSGIDAEGFLIPKYNTESDDIDIKVIEQQVKSAEAWLAWLRVVMAGGLPWFDSQSDARKTIISFISSCDFDDETLIQDAVLHYIYSLSIGDDIAPSCTLSPEMMELIAERKLNYGKHH